jgi:xanthine dehydrogenase accessory factor
MIVFPDGNFEGTIGGGQMESRVIQDALISLVDGKPQLMEYTFVDPQKEDDGVCGGQVKVFIEPMLPTSTLVVLGAGHVGKAVAYLADWLGFRVVVSDDRAELCTSENIPEADELIIDQLSSLPERMEITTQTFLVLTTRDVDIDVTGLPALLDTPAAYIGVIGSKRRWATTRKILIKQGISEDKLARVKSPIGIELNAETPEEIAVSIMAEIIKTRRAGFGEK